MVECIQSTAQGRRRLFWATQPAPCGETTNCGVSCGHPGLEVIEDGAGNASISTENWLSGLIINMLMTDGRKEDTTCGFNPGGQGGHWSESFMSGRGNVVGTLVRTVEPKGRVNEITIQVQAYARATLERLVTRGVARSVNVEVSYTGGGSFHMEVEVLGQSNEVAKVGLSGERLENGWVWGS